MKKIFLLLILCSSLTWCEAQCPSKLSVEISKIVPLTCYGDSNAIIDATPLNGISPYTYSWTGIVLPIPPGGSAIAPSTPEDSIVTGQPAGTYTVTVRDSCGNTASVTAIITQPTVVTAPAIDAVHGTDSVEFTISKPDSTLSYSWSATDFNGHTYTGAAINDTLYLLYYLRGATLTVSATNIATGCMASASLFITHPIISDYIPPANLPYARWSKRGMELANSDYYITASPPEQDSVVQYCKRNGITYVLLEDLEEFVFGDTTHYVDTAEARLLENFIALLKDSGNVEEVGVDCSDRYTQVKDSLAYNAYIYDINYLAGTIREFNWDFAGYAKIDVLSFDQEFEYGSRASSVNDFHQVHMPILRDLYAASRECPSGFLKVEDYLEFPTNPANTNFDVWDSIEVMEEDSVALYADRILLSNYTTNPHALFNEYDFILPYPPLGSDSIGKQVEFWPAFDPANEATDSCPRCQDYYGPANYLGDSLCMMNKTPDFMEELYYDSLAYGEKNHIFTDQGTSYPSTYTQFNMGDDTNFTIGGCFWFQYHCLSHVRDFDTGAASALKFYVSLGPNIQWFHLGAYIPPLPITLRARTHGGTPPFNYIFYNDSDRSVLQSSSSDTLVVHFLYPKRISVLAIDAATLTATDYMNIYRMCNEFPIEKPVKHNWGNTQTDSNAVLAPIRIYPNPNNGSFTLEYQLSQGETGKLILFNELGGKMGEYQLDANTNKMNIANNNLSNGVYIYQLWVDNKIMQRGKLVVIK